MFTREFKMIDGCPSIIPINPYPAPKNLYSLGYQVINVNQNTDESGVFINNPVDYAQHYRESDLICYFKLDASKNESTNPNFAGRDRYFFLIDKPSACESVKIELRVPLDLATNAVAMGNEWNGAELFAPALLASRTDMNSILSTFGLTENEYNNLQLVGGTPYVDLIGSCVTNAIS